MLIMNIDNYMYNCIYSVYYIYYIMDRVLFVLMVFNLVSFNFNYFIKCYYKVFDICENILYL